VLDRGIPRSVAKGATLPPERLRVPCRELDLERGLRGPRALGELCARDCGSVTSSFGRLVPVT
jgi:hypothetical protein